MSWTTCGIIDIMISYWLTSINSISKRLEFNELKYLTVVTIEKYLEIF